LDGKKEVFLTPGIVLGSFPLAEQLHLSIGGGVQIAATTFSTNTTIAGFFGTLPVLNRDGKSAIPASARSCLNHASTRKGADEQLRPMSSGCQTADRSALSETQQSDTSVELRARVSLAIGLLLLFLVAHVRKEESWQQWLGLFIKVDTSPALPKSCAEPGEFIVTLLKQSLALLLTVCTCVATAPPGFADQTDSLRLLRSGRETDSGTIAATGSANCVVFGRLGGADPRTATLSRSDCEETGGCSSILT